MRKNKPNFWDNVVPEGDCLVWIGRRHSFGYGRLVLDGTPTLAHRVAFQETYGPLEQGDNVLHHCDNPPCVKPEHLFKGTKSDNLTDMWSKGRGRWGFVKLTQDQVNMIRSSTDRIKDLAKTFGVSRVTIHDIRTYRTWKEAT